MPEPVKKRSRKVFKILLGVAVVLALLHLPFGGGVTISVETTRYTGPINSDGTIDYVTALNRELSQGVTADNNGAVLLARAAGPVLVGKEALHELGLEDLPSRGAYFVPMTEYVKRISDLTPTTQPAATADQIAAALYNLGASQPWTEKDQPLLAAWLKENAFALGLAGQASRRERYYFPLVSASQPPLLGDASARTWGFGVTLGWSLLVRAMAHAGRNDVPAAWQDILAAHRLARLVAQGRIAICALQAQLLEGMSIHAVVGLIQTGRLSAAQAKAMLAELDSLPPRPTVAGAMDLERLSPLEMVLQVDAHGVPDNGYPMVVDPQVGVDKYTGKSAPRLVPPLVTRGSLDRGQLLREWNQFFDRMVQAASLPTGPQRLAAARAALAEPLAFKPSRTRLIALRLVGWPGRRAFTHDIWLSLAGSQGFLVSLARADESTRVELSAERVCLALAAFRAERGQYPQRLEELVPAYLKEVPVDEFDGQPLRYVRQEKGILLYSVGADLVDETHPQTGRKGAGDDVVIRMQAK